MRRDDRLGRILLAGDEAGGQDRTIIMIIISFLYLLLSGLPLVEPGMTTFFLSLWLSTWFLFPALLTYGLSVGKLYIFSLLLFPKSGMKTRSITISLSLWYPTGEGSDVLRSFWSFDGWWRPVTVGGVVIPLKISRTATLFSGRVPRVGGKASEFHNPCHERSCLRLSLQTSGPWLIRCLIPGLFGLVELNSPILTRWMYDEPIFEKLFVLLPYCVNFH